MTVVAGFRVGSLVGRGAMGEVYRAVDADGNVVALKLLDRPSSHATSGSGSASCVSHSRGRPRPPNIVPTLSSGEDGGRL